jgi:hypothetical protein
MLDRAFWVALFGLWPRGKEVLVIVKPDTGVRPKRANPRLRTGLDNRQGAQFHDYADFERDGYRCTVPACTARRNLQSHHIHFRSAEGPDVAWNRSTLCAYHHHREVHAGSLAIRGRAPDGLVYTLGAGRFGAGDVKLGIDNGIAEGGGGGGNRTRVRMASSQRVYVCSLRKFSMRPLAETGAAVSSST